MQQHPDFRFSPHPNRAHEIMWRPWSEEAFREANETERPVFLAISAVWCHWCHVLDETTFSEPQVIAALNQFFIPIRVDNDRRPDINRRYNMGGWPSIAFLAPTGDIMTGATYLPPSQFMQLAAHVWKTWQERADELMSDLRRAHEEASRRKLPPPKAVTPDESMIAKAMTPFVNAYDEEQAGFGCESKFPRADGLAALLLASETGPMQERAAQIVTATLDAMRSRGLWDAVEAGFFRYATKRDWSEPHYEKMLDDNARLVQLYALASRRLERPEYLETARAAQRYLDARLWREEAGAYGGSQDADEDYYKLGTTEERQARIAPRVDPLTYTEGNALTVRGLTALALATGEDAYLGHACKVMTTLLSRRGLRGLLLHDDGPDPVDYLLDDQLGVLEALLDLHQVTGERRWREEAVRLWEMTALNFSLPLRHVLADLAPPLPAGPPTHARIGNLAVTDSRLADNSRAAAILATLGRILRSDEYLERARLILSALSPLADMMADSAVDLARAGIVVLKEPLQVTVVGHAGTPETVALLKEAGRLPQIHKVVDLVDPQVDSDIAGRAGVEAAAGLSQAYVCVAPVCLEVVETPEALRRAADRAPTSDRN